MLMKKESTVQLKKELVPVVDAHCDTITVLREQGRVLGQKSGAGQLDLPRLIFAGVNLQFFAAFIGTKYKNPLVRANEIFDVFFEEMAFNFDLIEPVFSYDDIDRLFISKKIAALLTVEGGEALSGRLEVLRMFYRIGVRGLTLTWNHKNELGYGVSEASSSGLTKFGVAVVREMNRLGMVIDVSHLSIDGFWDVIRESSKPVIASHSNCRALCNHKRNLDNQQIKALAGMGGVIGLCFYPDFLDIKNPSLESVLNHAEHIANIVGVDYIGLGSDFDGMDNKVLPGLADVTFLPTVKEGLLRRGFSKTEVQKIFGGNFLRVLRTVL